MVVVSGLKVLEVYILICLRVTGYLINLYVSLINDFISNTINASSLTAIVII